MAGRIDELRKRLEAQPASRLFAQLAEELRKDGQLDEAVRVCREGLKQHPAYPSAHMTLGRALFDKGDLSAARDEFEAVVAAAPDNILAGRLLGECLEGLGEHAAARKRYETTLLLAPDDPQLVARLAALPEAAERRGATGRHSVPPEGMRRAAAQSVVAAAVASAARDGREASSDAETASGAEAAVAGPPAAAGAPRGAVTAAEEHAGAGTPPPRRPEGASPGAGAEGSVEAGGAAASSGPESEPEAEEGTAGTIPFAEAPEPERPQAERPGPEEPEPEEPEPEEPEPEEPEPVTSRTLPFGTPAPKLPVRRPRFPGRDRRAETTPVSVEGVKRALAETEAAEAAGGGEGEIATATLAELYLKQGHPEKAAEVYRSILERSPDDADVRGRLEQLERERAARSARRGQLEASIARLERLLVAVQRARRA